MEEVKKVNVKPVQQTNQTFNHKTVNLDKVNIRNIPSFDENTRTAEVFNEITADGRVTREEFGQMLKVHSQIIRDFLVAQETVAQLERNPKATAEELDAARFMLQWLMIERDKSYQYTYQAFFYNQLPQEEIKKREQNEKTLLPLNFDYKNISALSNEVAQKLNEYKPETLGMASRISGVTPAAISILMVHLKKLNLIGKN